MKKESIKEIKNLIAQGALGNAIDTLMYELKDTKFEIDTIRFSSEFHRIIEDDQQGFLTNQEKSTKYNKLEKRVLNFLSSLESIDFKKTDRASRSKNLKLVITLFIFFSTTFVSIYYFLANKNKVKDQRDGQKYSVIEIDSLTWMAENMNYELKNNSFRRLNKKTTKDNLGKLYNFQGAQQACSGFSDGWRLPTKDEISRLSEFIKASPDSIFFKNFLGGESDSTGSFLYRRENGILWTNTEAKDNYVWILYLHGDSKKHEIIDIGDKEFGYSCRCVKKSSN